MSNSSFVRVGNFGVESILVKKLANNSADKLPPATDFKPVKIFTLYWVIFFNGATGCSTRVLSPFSYSNEKLTAAPEFSAKLILVPVVVLFTGAVKEHLTTAVSALLYLLASTNVSLLIFTSKAVNAAGGTTGGIGGGGVGEEPLLQLPAIAIERIQKI